MKKLLSLLLFLILGHGGWADVLVAAAASTKFAMEEIASQYEKQIGLRVKLVFGSSGQFYSQIMQGAPFDIFLAADEDSVLRLAQSKGTDQGMVYAEGKTVLVWPKSMSQTLKPVSTAPLDIVKTLLEAKKIRRFAIANPEHAPYGKAAVQILESVGLWEAIQPVLVYGENVSQTAQFAVSGSVQAAIVAYSLVLSPNLNPLVDYIHLPKHLHEPLLQRMVRLTENSSSKNFYEYLISKQAGLVFVKHGFLSPFVK